MLCYAFVIYHIYVCLWWLSKLPVLTPQKVIKILEKKGVGDRGLSSTDRYVDS